MLNFFRRPALLAAISALLLDLPFPLAGPLPPWRGAVAWLAFVPLLFGILNSAAADQANYLLRGAKAGYVCGVLWYLLNCYWIYDTMHIYGGISPLASCGILLLYSLVLGLYFAVFGLLIAAAKKAHGSTMALAIAPLAWVSLEFAASRITSVPWDQLGYSQVDNFILTRLAPFTGVYGISFLLMAGNALFTGALLAKSTGPKLKLGVAGVAFAGLLQMGTWLPAAAAPTEAMAVLVQPNLNVNVDYDWFGDVWKRQTGEFTRLSEQNCTPFYAGMPGGTARAQTPNCNSSEPIALIAWPESPAPFRERDPRFIALLSKLARDNNASVVAGNIAFDQIGLTTGMFNSAEFVRNDGRVAGRYDKIHLVPFGEYVPYKEFFFFAGNLTKGVSDFSRGRLRKVFHSGGHDYGVFICYESVFADEIRQFARNGADVFVNISDDGWYGDTSAPWQHLNMARMRAIENRRWILRDTNSGVTAAIDPYGRVTQSAQRHVLTSLACQFGYRSDQTFYTRHGDVFAITCVIITLALMAQLIRRMPEPEVKSR